MQKTIRAATLALGTFALAGFCGGAQAGFVFSNDGGGDGSIVGAYPVFTITGSDNGVGDNTSFYVETVATSQLISFTWYYNSNDSDSTAWDTAGYILDGTEQQLSVNGPAHLASNGSVVDLLLTAGDTFGFYVHSVDSVGGAGILAINPSSPPPPPPPPIPEPQNAVLMLAGLAALFAAVRRR
jgi:MYXO-CTERM domain-containing protein